MSIKSISMAIIALVLSTSVNAVVINTLNGVDYEWLELTETQGLSLAEVNQRLANANDALFGYEYASRQLVENLLHSYVPWDGVIGHHGSPSVTAGMEQFLTDFGSLNEGAAFNDASFDTVDGYTVDTVSSFRQSYGIYGSGNECGDAYTKCLSRLTLLFDESGTPVTMWINDYDSGFDATNANPLMLGWSDSPHNMGSYLVRTSVVPVPAAFWLFCSGLIGLIGFAKRKA